MPASRVAAGVWLSILLAALAAAASAAEPGKRSPPDAPQPPAATGALPVPEFGAIAFTADGSFSSAWKVSSKPQAEAKVRADCTRFRRGRCEVLSFGAELCVALVSARIGRGRKVTYSGGGLTPADARRSAHERCNRDRRARRDCHLRTVVCGDGR